MSAKSISMSLRLSPEDAATLASLKLADATTPSDKIRALIRLADAETAPGRSYADHLAYHGERLSEIANATLAAEAEHGQRSELLAYFNRWLPEIMAFYFASAPQKNEIAVQEELSELENGVADRIFLLFDYVLRLAVTGESPCYDSRLIASRAGTVTELAELISNHLSKKEDHHG